MSKLENHSTIESLANSRTIKVDFGSGSTGVWPGFIGASIGVTAKGEAGGSYRKCDYTDSDDPYIKEMKGRVEFATARHTICTLFRKDAVPGLKNILSTLVPGGYFLVTDHDTYQLLLAVSANDPNLLGPDFAKWYKTLTKPFLNGQPGDYSDLLNIGARGASQTEVKWRYSPEAFVRILEEAGFVNVERILPTDTRATPFSHFPSRAGEDMVFLCNAPL